MLLKIGYSLAFVTLLFASSAGAYSNGEAHATLRTMHGEEVGTVKLIDTPKGVLVKVDLHDIPPGPHGFHVHAVGACSPDFNAAGPHFNPENHKHGFVEEGQHAGDLPQVFAAPDGKVTADSITRKLSFDLGDPGDIFDIDGSAIILHEKADDYMTDPTGNSGARIACGVIERD